MPALLITFAVIFGTLMGASIVAALWMNSAKRNQPYGGFGISEGFYQYAKGRV